MTRPAKLQARWWLTWMQRIKLENHVPYFHTWLTPQQGGWKPPPLGMSYLKEVHLYADKKKKNWGGMLKTHNLLSQRMERTWRSLSVICWKNQLTPYGSIVKKYMCTVVYANGIKWDITSQKGLWNMSKCVLRMSQLAWETGSHIFWPLTMTNLKGPWMNVSWCVKLSHFLKGHSLWWLA